MGSILSPLRSERIGPGVKMISCMSPTVLVSYITDVMCVCVCVCVCPLQVRNLCYMVTRRERMKHNLCSLQEKTVNLQIQVLEEDLTGGIYRHQHTYKHPFSFSCDQALILCEIASASCR